MDWSKKRVFVTGAGGFIGSHLTERLLELGAHVKALVRYNSTDDQSMLDQIQGKHDVEVVKGNILDYSILRQAFTNVDMVFHLAAIISIPYSYRNPVETVQVNVLGSLNVLMAAREAGCEKVVHTSTSEVYGTAQYTPIDEKHPLQGQSPYSASKIGADKLAESFFRAYDLPVAICRPFNAYGPRQSTRAIIPTIITQALTQDVIKLGAATPTRNFNYVKDTVSGFIKIAESDQSVGEVINIGSEHDISIGDLARTIDALVGRECTIRFDEQERMRPAKSEVTRLAADATKARELTGWEPRHSLESGLLETIDWIKRNLGQFDATRYTV